MFEFRSESIQSSRFKVRGSRFSAVFLSFRLFPSRHEIVGYSEVIEDAGDDGIYYLLDGLRTGVEARVCGKDYSTGNQQEFKILNMYKVERGFTRDEDQFLFFFQNDIGGSQKHVFAVTMRNSAQCAHSTWNDHHCVRRIGTAGKRRIHAFKLI